MAEFGVRQQGFQGAFGLLREVFMHTTSGVMYDEKRERHPLVANSISYEPDVDGSHLFKATTLGIRPAPDIIAGLRKCATYRHFSIPTSNINSSEKPPSMRILGTTSSSSYEIKATLEISSLNNSKAGFIVSASLDFEEYTQIHYDPAISAIIVNRTHSSLIKCFNNETITGYFEPYTIKRPDGTTSIEDVDINIFVDGSLLEIFINDRFALTTRIYPARLDSRGVGVYCEDWSRCRFGEGMEVWDGLANAWPERPRNSSSMLVRDTQEQTGNGTWWSGE